MVSVSGNSDAHSRAVSLSMILAVRMAFSLEVAVRRDGQALVRLRLGKPRLQVGGDGVDRVGPREELLRRRLHRGELHERLAELRRISRLLAVIRLPLRFDRGRGAVA